MSTLWRWFTAYKRMMFTVHNRANASRNIGRLEDDSK
jgi:hypothetical protein